MEHYWKYCDHCEMEIVICGKCGNNTCNGGYGTYNNKECDKCEEAYNLFFKQKNI